MAVKNTLFKNNKYEKVRLVITGSQSGVTNYYYTEADGDRYYYTTISSTASPKMESASFHSYLSCTMSNSVTYTFDLVPMSTGETCMIETRATCINQSGSKGYLVDAFGGFRHTGSTLAIIGSTINYTTKTDFTTVAASFSASGTASVRLTLTGQSSETLDWDVYIKYTKGFHTLTGGGGGGGSSLVPVGGTCLPTNNTGHGYLTITYTAVNLVVNPTSTNVTCFGLCDGTANSNVTTPGATFLWSPGGQTTSSISNLCPGTYTVTVNISGCTATGSVTITQPNQILLGPINHN